jgi:hypothetical protein
MTFLFQCLRDTHRLAVGSLNTFWNTDEIHADLLQDVWKRESFALFVKDRGGLGIDLQETSIKPLSHLDE